MATKAAPDSEEVSSFVALLLLESVLFVVPEEVLLVAVDEDTPADDAEFDELLDVDELLAAFGFFLTTVSGSLLGMPPPNPNVRKCKSQLEPSCARKLD